MRATTLAVFLITTVTLTLPTHGQEDILNRIYGEGVHAFFRGDYHCAGSTMEQVINHGSRDPRAFYFRGLSHLRLGMYFEAESDFRQAATMEVDGTGTYDIGRTLERIQGPERLCLERIRRDTLLMLSQRQSVPGSWQGAPSVLPDFGRDLPLAPDPFRDDDPRIQVLPDVSRPVPPVDDRRSAPAHEEEDDPFATEPSNDGFDSDDSVPAPPAPAPPEESDDDDIFGSDPADNPFE